MARTIMVSNAVYEELKKAKGSDKSFSEVITEALEKAKPEEKTIGGLLKFAGILEGDIEYDEIRTLSKKRWKEWQDKSV